MNSTPSNGNPLWLGLGLSAALNSLLGIAAAVLVAFGSLGASTTGSAQSAGDVMNFVYAVIGCCPLLFNVAALGGGAWWRGPRFAGGWLIGLLIGGLIGGCAIAAAFMFVPVAP